MAHNLLVIRAIVLMEVTTPPPRYKNTGFAPNEASRGYHGKVLFATG